MSPPSGLPPSPDQSPPVPEVKEGEENPERRQSPHLLLSGAAAPHLGRQVANVRPFLPAWTLTRQRGHSRSPLLPTPLTRPCATLQLRLTNSQRPRGGDGVAPTLEMRKQAQSVQTPEAPFSRHPCLRPHAALTQHRLSLPPAVFLWVWHQSAASRSQAPGQLAWLCKGPEAGKLEDQGPGGWGPGCGSGGPEC